MLRSDASDAVGLRCRVTRQLQHDAYIPAAALYPEEMGWHEQDQRAGSLAVQTNQQYELSARPACPPSDSLLLVLHQTHSLFRHLEPSEMHRIAPSYQAAELPGTNKQHI